MILLYILSLVLYCLWGLALLLFGILMFTDPEERRTPIGFTFAAISCLAGSSILTTVAIAAINTFIYGV
jgi:hypothetical protein